MPVTTTTNKTSYACDASQTIFPFSFPIFAQTELVVVIRDSDGDDTTLTITTEYTVAQSGDSWDSGGNVTTVATWGAGNTIVIKRVVAETQETDYVENDAFAAETHENVVDKLTMIAQQIVEKLSRTVLLGEGTPTADLTLPEPNAEKYLAWMADLSGLKNVSALAAGTLTVSEFVETILDDANAAAVIATLGLDADLATLALPASTTISAAAATMLDDATIAAICNTIGALDVNNDTLDDVPEGSTYQKVHGDYVDANGYVDSIEEQGAAARLQCKVVEIGDWDMDTGGAGSATHTVAHGLSTNYKKIRSISVIIRDDNDANYFDLDKITTGTEIKEGGVSGIDGTNITLAHSGRGTGPFDNNVFDDVGGTQGNRGWVTIWYEV